MDSVHWPVEPAPNLPRLCHACQKKGRGEGRVHDVKGAKRGGVMEVKCDEL